MRWYFGWNRPFHNEPVLRWPRPLDYAHTNVQFTEFNVLIGKRLLRLTLHYLDLHSSTTFWFWRTSLHQHWRTRWHPHVAIVYNNTKQHKSQLSASKYKHMLTTWHLNNETWHADAVCNVSESVMTCCQFNDKFMKSTVDFVTKKPYPVVGFT